MMLPPLLDDALLQKSKRAFRQRRKECPARAKPLEFTLSPPQAGRRGGGLGPALSIVEGVSPSPFPSPPLLEERGSKGVR
jgi:hypothetical protein